MVEPSALGWMVKCRERSWAHQAGPYRSRDKAIRVWNEMQKEAAEDEDNPPAEA